jgi:hypothetical protein
VCVCVCKTCVHTHNTQHTAPLDRVRCALCWPHCPSRPLTHCPSFSLLNHYEDTPYRVTGIVKFAALFARSLPLLELLRFIYDRFPNYPSIHATLCCVLALCVMSERVGTIVCCMEGMHCCRSKDGDGVWWGWFDLWEQSNSQPWDHDYCCSALAGLLS